MGSTMLHGSPILLDDNTVPGVQYPPELEKMIPKVIEACYEFGLKPYPPVVELLTYDDISEIAAYGGFPVRFPHWSFGMEYEELSKGYEHGMHKIYEMVINSNPTYIYCLDSNPLLDHVTVIAHAAGHSDFFRNNTWFAPTTENAMNELANHGTRMRRYMDRWGREKVGQFIDWVLSIDDMIDLAASWQHRTIKELRVKDKREYDYARRLKLPMTGGEEHDYMEPWINDARWKKSEADRIRRLEKSRELDIFKGKEKDILGYLVKNAPLQPWQQDIISMLYREAQYFAPQALTKMLNEGWACLRPDSLVPTDRGFLTMEEIVDGELPIGVHDGNMRQTVYDWRTFQDRKIITVTTKNGYEVSGADNHRIFSADGEWMQLQHLKEGDRLDLAVGTEMWPVDQVSLDWPPEVRVNYANAAEMAGVSEATTTAFGQGKKVRHRERIAAANAEYERQRQKNGDTQLVRRKSVDIPTIANERFGAFLGHMTGDGHISRKKRTMGFTNGDDEAMSEYARLVSELFGVSLVCKWDDTSKEGRWRVRFSSRTIEEFLLHLGLKTGRCARIKTIPSCILKSPRSVMSAFLRAYFDDDASVGSYGIVLSTFSEVLGKQVQVVLLNYGILSIRRPQNDGSWHIEITGCSAVVFEREIGFGLTRKQKHLREYISSHKRFKREDSFDVVKTIEVSQGTVCDVSVSNTCRYAAQGFVNHNSYVDYNIMARRHWSGGGGIYDYAKHKMGVLGGKYSMNPYAIGFKLFLYLEEKWNKGRFGREWEQCTNMAKRKNWDTKAGLGHGKVFEVREVHNDLTAIQQFIDQEFVDEYELFVWERFPTHDGGWEYRIKTRDAKEIKKLLMQRYSNGGRPDIRLADPNHAGKGIFLLEHQFDGRILARRYAQATMACLWNLWNNGGVASKRPVAISTQDKDGREFLYVCIGQKPDQSIVMTRKQFEEEFVT